MGRAYFPPTTTGSDDEPHFPSAIPQAPQVGGVSRIEMKTSSRAAWPHGVSRSEMKILNRDNTVGPMGYREAYRTHLLSIQHTLAVAVIFIRDDVAPPASVRLPPMVCGRICKLIHES